MQDDRAATLGRLLLERGAFRLEAFVRWPTLGGTVTPGTVQRPIDRAVQRRQKQLPARWRGDFLPGELIGLAQEAGQARDGHRIDGAG